MHSFKALHGHRRDPKMRSEKLECELGHSDKQRAALPSSHRLQTLAYLEARTLLKYCLSLPARGNLKNVQ